MSNLINDIKIVAWKESLFLKTRVQTFEYRLREVILLLLFVGILPFWKKIDLLYSDNSFIFWLWFILINNLQISITTFVSERESSSLNILLASRLSDTSIIWGKLLVHYWISLKKIIILTVIITLVYVILIIFDLIDVNINEISIVNIINIIITCIFAPFFSSLIGVIYSMKSKNWEQAQHFVRIGFLVITVPIIVIYNIIDAMTIPGQANWNSTKILIAIYIILILFSINTIYKNFKREKLL